MARSVVTAQRLRPDQAGETATQWPNVHLDPRLFPFDGANGVAVEFGNPTRGLVVLVNSGASRGVYVRKGAGELAWRAGTVNSGEFATVPAGVTLMGPFDAARFAQLDGTVHLDVVGGDGTGLSLYAVEL
jgi:hypothetical protein